MVLAVVAVVALLVALNVGLMLELRSVNRRLDALTKAGGPGTDDGRRAVGPEAGGRSEGGKKREGGKGQTTHDHSHHGRYRGDDDDDGDDHHHDDAHDCQGHKHGRCKEWRRGRWHLGQAIAVVAVTWSFCVCCWGSLALTSRPTPRGAMCLLATVVARSLIAAAGLPTRPKIVTVVLASAGPVLALVLVLRPYGPVFPQGDFLPVLAVAAVVTTVLCVPMPW